MITSSSIMTDGLLPLLPALCIYLFGGYVKFTHINTWMESPLCLFNCQLLPLLWAPGGPLHVKFHCRPGVGMDFTWWFWASPLCPFFLLESPLNFWQLYQRLTLCSDTLPARHLLPWVTGGMEVMLREGTRPHISHWLQCLSFKDRLSPGFCLPLLSFVFK